MNAKVRLFSRVVVVLFLFFIIPLGPGGLGVVHGNQAAQAPDLDRALRANDLVKARQLVPVSWAASEQLFVSYLERAFITLDVIRTEPDARTLAGRLAEVFFRIIEYDFARAVVVTLDAADATKRQQLIGVVRDYFVALERVRVTTAADASTAEPRQLADRLTEIAKRFRELSFLRGEYWTLMTMLNVSYTRPLPAELANKVAEQLGDELSLVVRRPGTSVQLAMAERLGLPRRQALVLEDLAASLAKSTEAEKLEEAVKYLERARSLWRGIPVLESVNYWMFPAAAPQLARTTLPSLWNLYQRLKRPVDAQAVIAEAFEISRPFGERALQRTLSAFTYQAAGLAPDAMQQVLLCLKSDEVDLTADALASQATFQVDAGNINEGVATFNVAVQHAERAGHFKKAAQVANRAVAKRSLPASARVALAGRAINAANKANDPLELAKALRLRSSISTGTSNESFQDLQQAVAAAERHTAQSGDAAEEVACLRAMANERVLRGEYQVAIEDFQRAAEKAKALGSVLPRRQVEQSIYQSIVSIYATYLGEPGLGLDAAERLRELLAADSPQAVESVDPSAMANAYTRLAGLYQDLGQPEAALEAYVKALASQATAAIRRSTLSNRARYLTALGDYEAALRDWEEVLPLLKVTQRSYSGSATGQKAMWLGAVARVHALSGNREKALELAREAIAELNQDPSDTWVGKDFIDTAVGILVEANAADEAMAFCNTYYKKILARPIAQPVAERDFLERVARIDVKAGRLDAARSLLLSAVEIDRNHPTAEAGGLGGSLLALGDLEIAAGNYKKATEYLVAARAAANPYNLDQIWRIERALALSLARTRDGEGAAAHYDTALTTLEAARERLRPEEFRFRFGEGRDVIYEECAGLLAARALKSGQPADAVRAFQAAERKRAQILWGLLATGWSRIPPQAMPEQLRRALDMETRIGAKRALLREQFDQPSAKRNAALIELLQRDLTQLQANHAQVLASLAQSQYRFATAATLAASPVEPVQAALGPSRVLVEYLVTDERSYAFVVSATGVKVVPLAVSRAALRKHVQQLLAPFRQLRTGEIDLARLGYDTGEAYALYQAIFAPVQRFLGAATDIVIVPSDILHVLPFDALVEKAPQSTPRGQVLHAEFGGQAFLLRRYAISYLTSSASLLSSAATAGARQAAKQFFAMANPTAGRPPATPAYEDPLKRQLRSGAFDAFLTPLPGADVEVQRIARYFGRDTSTIVRGAQATEAAYDEQAGQFDILHFATHAVASDGQPLYSTLILAPDPAPGHDGFLQAYEVLRTPLKANLVVLSGCETALGTENWGRGLVGLVAAFEQAGARSVLATLWSIDEATAEVMAAFYGAMAEGKSTTAALRQAKLQLLQQRVRMGKVEVSLAHPFFWAPFILVGAPAGR